MKNKEKMPGFTADAALDKASQSYRLVGLPAALDSGAVLPQLVQRGPGGRFVTICGSANNEDNCITVMCDDLGCKAVNSSIF